jgi:hypothetical protein
MIPWTVTALSFRRLAAQSPLKGLTLVGRGKVGTTRARRNTVLRRRVRSFWKDGSCAGSL